MTDSSADNARAPEPAAVMVAVSELTPWAQNPRNNDHAIDKVAASIKRFGFGAPLVARKANGELIAGHTRLKAAIKLGLKKVPVRYLDIDETEAHLLAVADNKLAELSEWDDPKLYEVLNKTDLPTAELLGFDSAELGRMAREIVAKADADAKKRILTAERETDEELEQHRPAPDEGEELEDDEGGDNEEHHAMGEVPSLIFGRVRIPMSHEDSVLLERHIKAYVEQRGSLFGFGGRLLDAAER